MSYVIYAIKNTAMIELFIIALYFLLNDMIEHGPRKKNISGLIAVSVCMGAIIRMLLRSSYTDAGRYIVFILLCEIFSVYLMLPVLFHDIKGAQSAWAVIGIICTVGIMLGIGSQRIIYTAVLTIGLITAYEFMETGISLAIHFTETRNLFYLYFVVITICNMGGFIYYGQNQKQIGEKLQYVQWGMMALVGITLSMGIIYTLIYRIKRKYRQVIEEAEYIHEQYEFERIEKMYSEARKLRHDMKQCVTAVNGYIDDGEYEHAKEFLDHMVKEKVDAFGYIKYGSRQTLNYIINDKNARCHQYGIEFKCAVFGKLESIDEVDLSILIGNLLDNAIEAAAKSQEQKVDLEIIDKYNLEIRVSNSISDHVLRKNPGLITTKHDTFNHGYGTKSVRDIVAKYRGEIQYKEDYRMNCYVILLKK